MVIERAQVRFQYRSGRRFLLKLTFEVEVEIEVEIEGLQYIICPFRIEIRFKFQLLF